MGAPRIESPCKTCGEIVVWTAGAEAPRCAKCSQPIAAPPLKLTIGDLDHCKICGAGEFYIRKAFPKAVGIGIVVIAAAAAILLAKTEWVPPWAIYAPLFAAALIDAVLYKITADAAGCYYCKSIYYSFRAPENLQPFDLDRAEEIRLGWKPGSRAKS